MPFRRRPVKPALVLTTKNTKHLGADPGRASPSRASPTSAGEVRHQDGRPAAQRARQAGGARKRRYEAWLIDDEGSVTEGASTNAWIVTRTTSW
jgi:D-alanine transaminase